MLFFSTTRAVVTSSSRDDWLSDSTGLASLVVVEHLLVTAPLCVCECVCASVCVGGGGEKGH